MNLSTPTPASSVLHPMVDVASVRRVRALGCPIGEVLGLGLLLIAVVLLLVIPATGAT